MLKAPPFLQDLYYDLRDRRLLPLSPWSWSRSSPCRSCSAAPKQAAAAARRPAWRRRWRVSDRQAKLTVVQAKPGLRDYRKRLDASPPTDPFKQHYTGPVAGVRQLKETNSDERAVDDHGGDTA